MKHVEGPFFVAPYKDSLGGVDFLGLRQVNLDLMYEFLPGINNVTRFVRPYAVMTWSAWAFHEQMKMRGVTDFKRREFTAFREKVELLFGWSHQIVGAKRGMVGSTSKPPSSSGAVPLNFEAWKRNVSWIDAVNYGPSLKVDNGLGLLVQVKPGVFAVTTRGRDLAVALDAELCDLSGYRVLCGAADSATEAVARALHSGWNIEKPSAKERKVLWSALFDEVSIGQGDLIGRRSSAVRLIELVLRTARKPLQAYEIRETLAQGVAHHGRRLSIPDNLAKHHFLWVCLQVRQAQRLAMEAMFAWLERQVLIVGMRDSQALARQAARTIEESEQFARIDTFAEAVTRIKRYAKKQGQPLWCGGDDMMDMFHAMDMLQDAIGEDSKDLCPFAMHLLLLCSVIVEELTAEGVPSQILEAGGAPRVSLSYWNRHLVRYSDLKITPFLVNFLEIFMLSQHFGTATRRYEVGKQRLRVTIEESGLTPMISPGDLWYPAPAPDRIEAMLSLMADCGVIGQSDDEYFLKN